jgi:hypothetical protein
MALHKLLNTFNIFNTLNLPASYRPTLEKVYIGIDRLELSFDTWLLSSLRKILKNVSTTWNEYDDNKYHYVKCTVLDTEIIIKKPLVKSLEDYVQDRCYIEIFNSGEHVLKYLKDNILIPLCIQYYLPVSSVKIKQLEVKYDLYCKSSNIVDHTKELLALKWYMDAHMVHRYARSNSCRKDHTTSYFGRNGNIRNGEKGCRSYLKTNKYGTNPADATFLRIEFQFNAGYFRRHKITIDDLPFKPLDFEAFNLVEMWDDISEDGLKRIGKAILKKQGVTSKDTRTFNRRLQEMTNDLTYTILKYSNNRRRSVHQQFSEIKTLKKEYMFTMNHKLLFESLSEDKQIVICLADVFYSEDGCSKRMMFCQS